MNLPPPLNWLWQGWLTFSHILGQVMSKIILTIVWLIAFGFYAVVLKLIKLPQLWRPALQTYWVDVAPQRSEDLQHPF